MPTESGHGNARWPGRHGDETCGAVDRHGAASSLADRLRWRGIHQADAPAYEFASSAGVDIVTYGELARRSAVVAAMLSQAELDRCGPPPDGSSDRRPVLILCPPGLDYVVALWGCILANRPAVPAYPPDSERSLGRLGQLVADVGAACVLTHSALAPSVRQSAGLGLSDGFVLSLESANIDSASTGPILGADECSPGQVTDDDIVIIQYTSGSTSTPRGVILTQGNVINNINAITSLFRLDHESRAFVWLPPYHDMGLIGGIITPGYVGFPVRMMSPLDFLRNPSSWLLQVSETKATVSGGPNFAYDLVMRKFREDGRDLDLSSWRVAFNGAEPIRDATMEEFARRFSPYGFQPDSFLPCYGLAEATLLVSGGHLRPETHQRGTVSCGPVVAGCDVAVVSTQTGRPVADGLEGEIWLRGPSVSPGYWRAPADRGSTAELAGLSYVRTGDLGWLSGGELYVAGRTIDKLVRRGRNFFAQDLEYAATANDARLRSIAAAFEAARDEADSRIVLIVERADHEPAGWLGAEIRARVTAATGIAPDLVIVVPARTIPRTSSGKTQRWLCRERYLAGAYDRWLSAGDGSPVVAPAPDAHDDIDDQLAGLAALLAGVFGVVSGTECGIDVNLIAIGGDSLMASEIAAIIGESAGLPVPVDAVLTEPTPLRLARWLLRTWGADGADPRSVINRMAMTAGGEDRT